jgi:hypothetical protein
MVTEFLDRIFQLSKTNEAIGLLKEGNAEEKAIITINITHSEVN